MIDPLRQICAREGWVWCLVRVHLLRRYCGGRVITEVECYDHSDHHHHMMVAMITPCAHPLRAHTRRRWSTRTR